MTDRPITITEHELAGRWSFTVHDPTLSITAEERLEKAWEFAQLIYWTVEHPNPKEAELLLDQWAKLYATQPITRPDTNATQRNPA